MPAKGHGAGGGPPHWAHGWKPLDAYARAVESGKRPDVPSTLERIRSARAEKVKLHKSVDLAAVAEREGGFTYNPRTGGLLKVGQAKGFAVAVPGTTEVVGEEKVGADQYVNRGDFAKAFSKIAAKHRSELAKGAVIGGWYSPETNQYVMQLTQVFPSDNREAALTAARNGHQDAIFDLSTGETIFTRDKPGAPRRGYSPENPPLSTFVAQPSVAELEAAKFYTGPGYKPLNSHLRFGNSLPPAAQHYLSNLDKLISKSVVSQDAVTYRGVQSGSWLPRGLAPGSIIHDNGYQSTAESAEAHYPGDTRMIIHVPKGAHALDLYAHKLTHHSNEKELLLARGTPLRVVSDVESASGQRIITAEVVT